MLAEAGNPAARREGLFRLLQTKLARPGARLARLNWQGRTLGRKRPEVRSRRWRLQKGDPARVLRR
jgi:hypothetical protein